jgi:hypothetical protein
MVLKLRGELRRPTERKDKETYGSVAAGFHVTRSVPSAAVSLGVFSLMPITDGSTQANRMLKKKHLVQCLQRRPEVIRHPPSDENHC